MPGADHLMHIGGAWVESDSGATMTATSPATGETIGSVPEGAEAYDEVDELGEYLRMAAADARRLEGSMPPSVDAGKRALAYQVPRGVVAVITPWNRPYTMPAEVIAPALASGNAVVWVPAPTTSICAVKLAECIVDAELPAGVFNLVTGPGAEVGDEIAGNAARMPWGSSAPSRPGTESPSAARERRSSSKWVETGP